MSDLATWLIEQIAEDERVAREAATAAGGKSWYHPAPHLANTVQVEVLDAPGAHVATDPDDDDWYQPLVYDEGACPDEAGEHIAAWDPARVLAECEAKRRIVDLHRPVDGVDENESPVAGCGRCIAAWNGLTWTIAGPCLTARLSALPYADRPGYRDEWRP